MFEAQAHVSPTGGGNVTTLTQWPTNQQRIPARLLDSLHDDEITRTTAGSHYDGTNDIESAFSDTTRMASTLSGVQDATPWDADLESGGTTPGLETMPKPIGSAMQKESLWLVVRQRARNDPLSVAGILAGVIVLPFVIRGSTR